MANLDKGKTESFVNKMWDESILPELKEYIKIPNISLGFDKDWKMNGHMDRAMALIKSWVNKQDIKGMKSELLEPEGKTPLLFIEIESNAGRDDDTVFMYGHMDKQPECGEWREGLDPWTPVVEGDRLYGRGGADDGYSCFASLAAIMTLHEQGAQHGRIVVMIEAGEESGSPDLPYYVDQLRDKIGSPSLIICLDSATGNYDQMWLTNALRGALVVDLNVSLMKNGVHSGQGSGLVASSFRVMREILDRVEDSKTGEILVASMNPTIPAHIASELEKVANILGPEGVYGHMPTHDSVLPVTDNLTELLLNNSWRPTLCVVGMDGFPDLVMAGQVLREKTTARLSFRLPPNANPGEAFHEVKGILEADTPYGARVDVEHKLSAQGWSAPPLSSWLSESLDKTSNEYYGGPTLSMGLGGTIPFMQMLGEKFPEAQFVVTGLLGPESNAHGPNEFLHIPYAKKLTCCIASVISDHYGRNV